jgi:O-acetyl-ADP-ribose deacetylase (regulator of RNase III)
MGCHEGISLGSDHMIDSRNQISVVVGDILDWSGDAIVNPAHTSLLAGGGLCGAIHKRSGPFLEAAAKNLAPCPVGEVRITPAFNLNCRFVIHAVGPRWWDGTRGEVDLQKRMYESVARIAENHGMKEVAVPAIGIGIHRFPIPVAAEICCTTLFGSLLKVRFLVIVSRQEIAEVYLSFAKAQTIT